MHRSGKRRGQGEVEADAWDEPFEEGSRRGANTIFRDSLSRDNRVNEKVGHNHAVLPHVPDGKRDASRSPSRAKVIKRVPFAGCFPCEAWTHAADRFFRKN